MRGERGAHEGGALVGECRVPGAPVLGAGLAAHEAAPLEPVDEVGHAAARHEQRPLHLAEQHAPLVVQRLENAELGEREVVAGDVGGRAGGDRGVGAREHHPQLERVALRRPDVGTARSRVGGDPLGCGSSGGGGSPAVDGGGGGVGHDAAGGAEPGT
jgi:hypothetical protein